MGRIIAFCGSNSSTSINHVVVNYTATLVESHDVKVIRLSDYDIPMYGIDHEQLHGFPEGLKKLKTSIEQADGLIISVAEHNGNVTAFFKSVFDWLSRMELKFLDAKKVLLLSSSDGKRGALSARESAEKSITRFGGHVIASMGIPCYSTVFKDGILIDEALNQDLQSHARLLTGSLK